ncbi:TonB-dependent siderophore receptor [Sphingosinicella sp. CPCC 101087]|uniref:TonB-dependent receptor plug domain-containing protein n=1 Tax=Sphingosinicella sp. CPCC 101087 TaxID=2497754 RepID=UPI00197DF7E2|nr:TonB-dependent receptor [Sphingosinicella sp. CPCC 101087]
MANIPYAAFLLAPAIALSAAPATAAEEAETAQDLLELSIEELARIPVQSASKQDEPLSAAPTALYVITGREIEASGALSIAEALRLAPNLQVQQVDARQYAVTARGFNGIESANKLLVLIDGRTIYSPLASTVFWELHNLPVEDIRQIEAISGPGGTLYGPNAVNGVVSIVTRDAHDTLGGLVRATAGEQEQTAAVRYGTPIGTEGAARFYLHVFNRDGLPRGMAPDLDDRFQGWQGGFRADFARGADHLTLQGDLFDTDSNALPGDGDRGHNLLARWTRAFAADSTLRVQAYYDWVERDFLLTHDSLQTFDVEAQLNQRIGGHDLVVGAGLRTTRDEFINNLNEFELDPVRKRLWVMNAFVQDRVALTSDLSLVLGIKAEQTSFTGIELLPNVRVAWQPDERTLLWGAISRAVRTPSRIDRQLANLPFLAPAPDFVSEKLVAFEAGYRGQPTERTSLSVSVFFNIYDDLRSAEPAPDGGLPIRLSNGWKGHSYGVEAWSSTQLTAWWRVNLGLATLWKDFELKPGRIDLAAGGSLGHDPEYQLLARTQMDVAQGLRLDAGLRRVGELEATPGIGGYVEADARLGYRVSEDLELFVAGRNLLHRDHAESDDVQRGQAAERSLLAGTRVTF